MKHHVRTASGVLARISGDTARKLVGRVRIYTEIAVCRIVDYNYSDDRGPAVCLGEFNITRR